VTDAEIWCNFLSASGTGDTLATVDEAGSCKDTLPPELIKACYGCEYDQADPTPRPCIGKNYYLYLPVDFPDGICSTFMAGTPTYPPYPAY
jgi:hypothetical protein